MAELTHEQLWHVCQRKPDDYDPYGKRKRLTGTTIIAALERASDSPEHGNATTSICFDEYR